MTGKFCINMIVKNEAKTLPRLFASFQNLVDFYVISDTGSTDNTLQIIKELGEQYAIPGIITEDKWVNFAHNRNITLKNAYKAYNEGKIPSNWLLIVDADEELDISPTFSWNQMDPANSYTIFRNDRGTMIKSKSILSLQEKNIEWKGEIHNYLQSNSNPTSIKPLSSLEIIYNNFEGAKSHEFNSIKEKALKDKELLEKEVAATTISFENSHRFFQLACACESSENYTDAMRYFQLVSTVQKSNFQYNAYCKMGCIAFEQFNDKATSELYLKEATHFYPNRKDAYYYLAMICQRSKDFETAYELLTTASKPDCNEIGSLFDKNIYEWKIDFQLVTLENVLRKYESALNRIEKLKEKKKLPLKEKLFLKQLTKIVQKKLL